MDNKDEPSFPIALRSGIHHQGFFGLTKREYFAGWAMQANLANPNLTELSHPQIAASALKAADALLAALEDEE